MFRVLTVICVFIWADHANAGGLGDFLKAIESLDQSIQEKVQDALGSPEPDNQAGAGGARSRINGTASEFGKDPDKGPA